MVRRPTSYSHRRHAMSKPTQKPLASATAAIAANANLLPPAPAPIAAKPEPLVDQATVDAFLNAEANVVETALALFHACCWHRVSPAQFGTRSDAKVRASEFNCARTVAEQAGPGGAKFAQGIIVKASK